MTRPNDVPHWWTIKCDRCGEISDPKNLVQDPEWGLLCGRLTCNPEDYTFDAGFDSHALQYPMRIDLTPAPTCPACNLALPVTGECGSCEGERFDILDTVIGLA